MSKNFWSRLKVLLRVLRFVECRDKVPGGGGRLYYKVRANAVAAWVAVLVCISGSWYTLLRHISKF